MIIEFKSNAKTTFMKVKRIKVSNGIITLYTLNNTKIVK
jgi:hypothetical protein